MQPNFKKFLIILAQCGCFIFVMAIAQGLKGYNAYILSALLPCAAVWLIVKAINYFAKKNNHTILLAALGAGYSFSSSHLFLVRYFRG